jgi:hypothetical protein
MNTLLISAIGTELILFTSVFLLYVSSIKTRKSLIIHIIIFIIGAAPLLYAVIDDAVNNYPDANIGLGLLFMYTWIFSGIAFIIWIMKLIIIKKKS